MEIIPVINYPDGAAVEKMIAVARTFLHADNWIHLDVSDGSFTPQSSWHDSAVWAGMKVPFHLEVHLMVMHPEDYIVPWCAAGAKRVIVHIETVSSQAVWDIIAAACRAGGAELMIASDPETPVEMLRPYLKSFKSFQVLAVHPGPSGQSLLPIALEKIKFLRREAPNAIIEVDGGINLATVKSVRDAGANIAVSATYIFESRDPKKAYEELKSI
jgi:ribulose-phosphate 3-epimerase